MLKTDEKLKQDKEQHKKDALKVLASLDTLKCNSEGSNLDWKSVIEFRRTAVNEFLTWLETGNTKHIVIDSSQLEEKRIEHFK